MSSPPDISKISLKDIPESNPEKSPKPLLSPSGWDGKARIINPEAQESDYSDEENVLRGDLLPADEDLLVEEPDDAVEIQCVHSRVQSIDSLKLTRFTALERLCLRQNSITEITPDCFPESLKELDVYDNLIKKIRNLDKLDLTSLDLSFNKIRNIENIQHLVNLTEIFFVGNKIELIQGLETLKNLRSLELGSNRIREIQNLDALENLEELWLAKNKITSLDGLPNLPKLRLLSIQSNRIRDLSPLATLPHLEELYVSHNAITSLEGLEKNTALTTIDISNNQVVSLQGIGPLTNLEELWASYNLIEDVGELDRQLRDKKALTTVYLEGNPLQLRNRTLYRNKVRLALPQLSQIDATYVVAT